MTTGSVNNRSDATISLIFVLNERTNVHLFSFDLNNLRKYRSLVVNTDPSQLLVHK